MAKQRSFRWLWITSGVIALLVVAGILGFQFAARSLKAYVLQALGPESEVADLHVGFTRIIVSGVRVKAPRGWPSDSTLRAERVTILPDLRQLLSRRIYVTKVTVENGYISLVRPKEGGGLKLLPSMLNDSKKAKANGTGRTADIQSVELDNCTVELFDQSVMGHAKIRVDGVQGTVTDVKVPTLDSDAKVDLKGLIKGPVHQGTVAVKGWINVAHKSSELTTAVRNVDLARFEPYILQKAKAGIDQGTFNLDLNASVRSNIVTAQGVLRVESLKLKTGEGPLGGFKSLPQTAVLGALKDDEGEVKLDFELHGGLDNPAFSLTGSLGLRTATALLKGLGLGFEALIRAFFTLFGGFGMA